VSYRFAPATPHDMETLRKSVGSDHVTLTLNDKDLMRVALKSGRRVVGCYILQRHGPHEARFRAWFVLPEYRGKGLGTVLFHDALSTCRGLAGITEMTLVTRQYAIAKHWGLTPVQEFQEASRLYRVTL